MSRDGLKNTTCTIQRCTVSAGARGISTESWADSATSVKCSIYQLSAKEEMQAKGWGLDADYIVTLPDGTTIRSNPPDRVTIGGTTYLVRRVDSKGRNRGVYAWVKEQA